MKINAVDDQSWMHKIGLAFSTLGLFCLWFYLMSLKPLSDQIVSLREESMALNAELKKQNQLVKQRYDVQKSYLVAQAQFKALMNLAPVLNHPLSALEKITQLAHSSGLIVELFSPQTEISHHFYIEMPLQLTLLGTYSQCCHFIDRLMTMHQLITIDQMDVTQYPSNRQMFLGPDKYLRIQMIIKVYRQ